MQALIVKEQSPNPVLETVPIPAAIQGTAVVKILSTSVDPHLRKFLSGKLPMPTPPRPFVLSGASVGRIHEGGPDTTTLKPGQLVFVDPHISARDVHAVSLLHGTIATPTEPGTKLARAWNDVGGMAQYTRCALENVFPLDEGRLVEQLGYSFAELTQLLSHFTVSAGLIESLEVKPGDRIIIAPSTGRFSGTAVQVALAMGCQVVAGGRNEDGLAALVKEYGDTGRLTTVKFTGDVDTDSAALRGASGGDGVGADAFFDWSPPQAAGTTHIAACIKALRFNGRCALMGAIMGNLEVPYGTLMFNNIRIQGRYMYEKEHALQILKLVESGILKIGMKAASGTREHAGFKLEDIEKAFDVAEGLTGWTDFVAVVP